MREGKNSPPSLLYCQPQKPPFSNLNKAFLHFCIHFLNNFFIQFNPLLRDEAAGGGFGGDEAGLEEGIDEEGPLRYLEFWHVLGGVSFPEDTRKFLRRGICGSGAVVESYDFLCEAGFGVTFAARKECLVLFLWNTCAALEVGGHEIIANGHDLAVHVLRRVCEIDAVVVRLTHFASIRSFEELQSEDELLALAEDLLEMTPTEHVEFLVTAAEFTIDIEDDGVVADEEGVKEFVYVNRFPLLLAPGEHLPLRNLLYREVARELHEECWGELLQPFVVVPHGDLGKIQNFRCLRPVRAEVLFDLLTCQRLPLFRATRGVADRCGEAADDKGDLVPRFHECLELPEGH